MEFLYLNFLFIFVPYNIIKMKKKKLCLTSIVAVSFLSLSMMSTNTVVHKDKSLVSILESSSLLKANQNETYRYNDVIYEKNLTSFMYDVACRESRNYQEINTLGYIGRYQFGSAALKDVGIKCSKKEFLNDKDLQDEAFLCLCAMNKYRMRHYISKYSNKTINGIKITESGILASSHLIGASDVKKYLSSNGKMIKKDQYGTSLEEYLRLFSGYDTSSIIAKRICKVK